MIIMMMMMMVIESVISELSGFQVSAAARQFELVLRLGAVNAQAELARSQGC